MEVITIGRNPENEVVISDLTISYNHCQTIKEDNA